jgi:hypothetical protein
MLYCHGLSYSDNPVEQHLAIYSLFDINTIDSSAISMKKEVGDPALDGSTHLF